MTSHRLCTMAALHDIASGRAVGAFLLLRERLDPFELNVKLFEFLVRQIFEVHELVARAFHRENQLVQLQLHGLRVAVLRILDQEYRKVGDDGGACVDHELPSVREVDSGPLASHTDDQNDVGTEEPWRAENDGSCSREPSELGADVGHL